MKRCNIRRDFITSLLVYHKLNFSKEPNYGKKNSKKKFKCKIEHFNFNAICFVNLKIVKTKKLHTTLLRAFWQYHKCRNVFHNLPKGQGVVTKKKKNIYFSTLKNDQNWNLVIPQPRGQWNISYDLNMYCHVVPISTRRCLIVLATCYTRLHDFILRHSCKLL
jgi:hypothetical protein